MPNQNPEQIARDNIDRLLLMSGWLIQSFKHKNIAAGFGVAIREYSTDTGPADYILFVNKKPVGLIEAKREEEGVRLTMHEEQSAEYATMEVHKRLGNGFQEVIYQRALQIEMNFAELNFEREMEMPIFYRDTEIGTRRVDWSQNVSSSYAL